jgi:RNA polymerase sigma factor (sigma-70 family)
MHTADITDEAILAQLRESSTLDAGFRLLIRKYQERLYWQIRRMVKDHDDADDVLQNVFVKIFRNIHQFKEQSGLFTWIYRIATNESLTFLEKNKYQKNQSELSSINEVFSPNSTHAFDEAKAIESLEKAIQLLPDKQKLVFNMRYYDELSYQEIADITQTSVGALKATYHHAIKKIEDYVINKVQY